MAMIATFENKVSGKSPRGFVNPLRIIGSWLIGMAEAMPQIKALNRLNALSDEDLARLGTTREAQVRRILGPISGI